MIMSGKFHGIKRNKRLAFSWVIARIIERTRQVVAVK
jgi:hypothetical protein